MLNYEDPATGSVSYAAVPYGVSQYAALAEYATADSMFTNVHSADC
jgi:hypothetical protein